MQQELVFYLEEYTSFPQIHQERQHQSPETTYWIFFWLWTMAEKQLGQNDDSTRLKSVPEL